MNKFYLGRNINDDAEFNSIQNYDDLIDSAFTKVNANNFFSFQLCPS